MTRTGLFENQRPGGETLAATPVSETGGLTSIAGSNPVPGIKLLKRRVSMNSKRKRSLYQ